MISDSLSPSALELLTPQQVAADAALRSTWETSQNRSADLYALYQSTTWWDHLVATRSGNRLRLGAIKTGGRIAAAIPLESRRFQLPLHARRCWSIGIPFRVVCATSVDPLSRLTPEAASGVLDSIATGCSGHSGLYIKSIDRAMPLWNRIVEQPKLSNSFVYVADKLRPLYSVSLAATFDEYLRKFSGKTRNTLRRKVKLLKENVGGELSLVRASDADDVQTFIDDVRKIGKRSWKKTGTGWSHISGRHSSKQLQDVANRGFWRSYVLRVGDVPCAFVNGYQYGGVYHYADLAYDEQLARWSPGLVLLFLLIEDLHAHDSPRHLNFGTGYADYKRQFANNIAYDASLLVLRRSILNHLRTELHSSVFGLKDIMRKWLRKNDAADEFGLLPTATSAAAQPDKEKAGTEQPAAIRWLAPNDPMQF
jgi:CelD/BcsL family acetyltransferase involved in cellulose biosynthesis